MNIKLKKTNVISDQRYTYKKVDFDLEIEKGKWESQTRFVLDRGNGAVILLYNKTKKTVILTEQFRLPTHLNGNASGMLIEAPAGTIEGESPLATMIRETEEETGYRIQHPQKIFEAYTSPAAVTEILYFFIAEYDDSMKKSAGGGLAEEHEHIEVKEVAFEKAMAMMKSGEIKDAKTIMLLQYAALNELV